jgi:hypothetical protein
MKDEECAAVKPKRAQVETELAEVRWVSIQIDRKSTFSVKISVSAL